MLQIGDKVMLAEGYGTVAQASRVFEVVDLPTGTRGVKYKVRDVESGKVFKAPEAAFRPAPTAIAARVPASAVEPLNMGNLVTISGPGWKRSTTDLYVVIGTRSDGKIKVVKLGGEGGKYYNGLPRAVVHLADVPSSLA